MDKNKIVIVGEAGSGKDYAKRMLTDLGLREEISYTTRPPRTGEIGGKDYHYTTETNMLKMISDREFIQVHHFPNGFTYGTSKNEFEKNDVFIMTPEGLSKLGIQHRMSCFIVYIAISEDIRRERLNKRENFVDGVEKRIKDDYSQFKTFSDYDKKITNHNFTTEELIEGLPSNIISKINKIS